MRLDGLHVALRSRSAWEATDLGFALARRHYGRIQRAFWRTAAVEVANVAASLFNADGGPHLKLREVVTTAQALPAGLSEMAARASERIDLEVNITGYGQGQMSVLLTA